MTIRPYGVHAAFHPKAVLQTAEPQATPTLSNRRERSSLTSTLKLRPILGETADNRDGFAALNAEAAVQKAVSLREGQETTSIRVVEVRDVRP